jgi:hypothetical protein
LANITLEATATAFAEWGWRADAAAIEAMASASRPADSAIVNSALRAVYLPWLDASARQFQRAMSDADSSAFSTPGTIADQETCLVFADGLRFDAASALKLTLEMRGLTCHLAHRMAAIPTATPTAKPAISPVSDALTGNADAADFAPVFRDTGLACTAERLRDAMTRRDVTVLGGDDVLMPTGERGGWTECGQIDALGHKIGLRLARELPREVEQLADRVSALIDGGWARVRVVTDHGWLLVPGGLPKVEIPKSVTATRWARCALVLGESATDMPVLPWRWNPSVRIASPHGVASFVAGHEYAHGGLSPQECVVPELLVQRTLATVTSRPTIAELKWSGLRCRVVVVDPHPHSSVDIRLNWKDARSSIVASPKNVEIAGHVSVVVPDDSHEGAAAVVVLLDHDGAVVARTPTTVGGEG